ncbi:hypothetical protein A0O34_04930 [Chryseobacterium glaciei]|uniref:Uncharacterized protein n=1 Tax=Chryseobacterium glaciei TaxID=1685010 RepID=A0A172XSD5_9FLAO|nr:hypothetical protein [Chryseobacterium glaciei]ANF49913.1 hypothetical protein A0O34_04930 [Chryseobacterium glaciei]
MVQNILEKKYPFRKEYGVVQTLFENDEKKSKITFIIEIERLEPFEYSIRRKNILINDKVPDLVIEQLSEKIGNVFFPLEVETLESGNLKHISNLDEIRKRWKSLKPKLVEYYKGKLAKELIKNVEDELESKNIIQNRILNSLFYRLYFLPFRDYIKEENADFDLYLPVFPFKNKVKYNIKIIDSKLSEEGKGVMKISGKCIDQRSFEQIINNRKNAESDEEENNCGGKVDLIYQFNKEDGSVFSIQAEIGLQSKDEKNIRLINFELYQL